MKMYALRMTRYKMFIRASDGGGTDNKASAMLFDTIESAREYVTNNWRTTCQVSGASSMDISIIEVETKPVIQKIGKEVEIV